MVYLIHLDRPLVMDDRRAARHYIGWTNDERPDALARRMSLHKSGRGSKFLRAAKHYGIAWHLVALYRGTPHDERRLKNVRHSERYCPICRIDPKVNPRWQNALYANLLGLTSPTKRRRPTLLDNLERLNLPQLYGELREYT